MENKLPVNDGIEWQPWVTRNMSFWHQCLSVEGSYKHQRDFGVNSEFDYMSLTVDGMHTTAFGYTENIQKLGVAVMAAVDSDEGIEALKQKYIIYGDELKQILQKCLREFTVDNWNEFIRHYRRYAAGLIIPTVIGRRGSEILMKKLAEYGMASSMIENTVNTVTYPLEHTPLFDSQLTLLKIGAKIQTGEMTEEFQSQALQKWVDDYGYIPVNFCEEPWSITDAQQRLASLIQKNCAKELETRRLNHKEKVVAAKRILSEIGDEKIEILAHALQVGTSLNEYRKNVFSWLSLNYRPLFAKLAVMVDLESWRDCFYLYPQEMTSIMENDKVPVKSLIKQRSVIAIKMKDECLVEVEPTQARMLQEFVQQYQGQSNVKTGDVQEVKGVVANRGKVIGTVKIVLSSKDFHKVNLGDVLVTTMTSVDFVSVMERAVAFVTNEGGITSHAAIVAREMNKPCIIGTKVATKVLKDGDLVEVDAEKGVVKKL